MIANAPDEDASLARESARRGVVVPVAVPEFEPESERVSLAPGVGTLLGKRYRLASRLGEGGMGTVWRSHDDVLDIDVAIKVMRPGLAGGDSGERMLREGRSTARLVHPSIVRIFDFGRTDDDDPFLVMELLRGELLGGLMDRRVGMSATDGIALLLPVASALCVAHHQGIVHRDLKPENILLSETELGKVVPKVLDFGIAKLHHLGLTRLTQTNAILGTPDYMSPEQARGRGDVDERTDIWAFTVMLYECICSRRPFQELNYNAQMRAILDDEPLPIMAYGAGDEELWTLLARGLAKRPEDRWQSVRAFGQALALWAQTRGLEHDVTGGSLVAHWLPPRVSSAASAEEVVPPPPRHEPSTAPTLAALISPSEPPGAPPAPAVLHPPRRRRRGAAATWMVVLTALLALATWWRSMPSQSVVAEASTAVAPSEPAVPALPSSVDGSAPDPLEGSSVPPASAGESAKPAPPTVTPPPKTSAAPIKAPRPRAPMREPPERSGLPPATPNF